MEFNIDVPDEIKPKIMQKLIQNGILKTIKRKVKMGMMIAVQEIRENNESESILERKIFKNASPYELKALQSVFNFLATYNLNYTLSTLLEESAVRRSSSDTTNVLDLIDNEINHPENPTNNYIIDEDNRYLEENIPPLKEDRSKPSKFQENKAILKKPNNYYYPNETVIDFHSGINDSNNKNDSNQNPANSNNDNNYMSNSSSENNNYNYPVLNNKPGLINESNSQPNLELQGFKITRRTFERNPFIISVINL